ncbi:MAG: PAS domain S-box protein [Acidimicrobiia bacterium]|nr:PAS domain S-box protein [Acidimicrobiia bacterium]
MSLHPVSPDILAATIDQFPEGIAVVRKVGPELSDFEFLLVNEAFEQLAQVDREDLVGGRVIDHFPMLEATGYFERLIAALESGERQALDPTLYDDGRIRVWTRTTYTPIDDQHVMVVGLDITEAMESLATQSVLISRMERVESLAKVGSWTWELSDNTIEWSPEVWRIYGLEPKETTTYEEERALIHPDDREARDAIAEQWLSGKSGGSHEYRVVVNGKVKHIRGIAEPIEEDGEVVRFIGAIHDITEVVAAHELRLEAESQFRLLYDASPLGVLLIDREGTVSAANAAATGLFGLPSGASAGLVGRNLFDDEQLLSLGHRWHIERALAGETVDLPTHRYDMAETPGFDADRPEGHTRWLDVKMFPTGDGIAAIVSDVTLRHLARGQLRKASAIIDSMSNGLVVTDTEGTITDVNPAFTDITGYSRAEAIGQNPSILKSEAHDQRFYERMWRDIIEQGKWSGEITNRRKDGTAYQERLTITSIYDHESGAPNGFIGVFTTLD